MGPLDPDLVAIFGGIFIVTVGFNLSRAFARRMERPALTNPEELARIQERLEALQQSLDSVALEVERQGEMNRYLTKVLTERALPPENATKPAQ